MEFLPDVKCFLGASSGAFSFVGLDVSPLQGLVFFSVEFALSSFATESKKKIISGKLATLNCKCVIRDCAWVHCPFRGR